MKTNTHWVNTQKGFELETSAGKDGAFAIPNTPVTYHYLVNCPTSWVENEWVREATPEEHELIIKTNVWELNKKYWATERVG